MTRALIALVVFACSPGKPPADRPPPSAAYFLVGRTAVTLDETGFHVIAQDVRSLHPTATGAYACNGWRVVAWDGTRASEIEPPIYAEVCAAGPDGALWIGAYVEDGRLARFDGTHWETWRAPWQTDVHGMRQLVIARDGTAYAHAGGQVLVLENRTWRALAARPDTTGFIEHLFIGGDGNAWVLQQVTADHGHPDALLPLRPAGYGAPVFIDDHFQTSRLWANVDAAGVATIFDARRNLIVQGAKAWRLPAPNTHLDHDQRPGGFAHDGAGRIWVDLVDGLNVFERDGTRHVFPVGSIDAIRAPIGQLFVVGAGPALPALSNVATRTIAGTVPGAPYADVVACVEYLDDDAPCGKGVATARTDAEGRFEMRDVPRYALELYVLAAERWARIDGACCDGATTVDFKLREPPRY